MAMSEHASLARQIRRRLEGAIPRVALVLGSGLSEVADGIEQPTIMPYEELDGFPVSTVQGHSGRLVVGRLQGVMIACMQGRHHAYEGHPVQHLALPVRTLQALGCHTLLLTNAAGSLHTDLAPGNLMAIRDHINWAGVNPLVGANDEAIGPRFFDMGNAWDRELRAGLHKAAERTGIALQEGVYVMAKGPNFETPAEVQAMARLGGDAVGMSTVPECLVARHCGMRVAGVSLITNFGAGLGERASLSHRETLSEGADAATRIASLLKDFLPKIGDRTRG